MAQKFSNPQGSSSSQNNNAPVKKITPALFFSGIFVAISFIVMLIPLALFNVAQVAAMLGKRIALFLMTAVAGSFFLFGYLFSNINIIAMGFFVILAIPFFMAAICFREKRKHWLYAASVLFLPAVLFFGCICFTPVKLIEQNGEIKSELQMSIEQKKEELQAEIAGRKPTAGEIQLSAKYDQLSEQITQIISMPEVKKFIEYNSWQRIAYFVYGAMASTFLIGLLTSFANVVFVDFGYEQIERLRSVVNYIRRNPSSFSSQIVSVLFSMPMVRANRLETPIYINHHSSQSVQMETDGQKNSFLRTLWKPLKPKNTILWQGYAFQYEGKSAWDLRNFSLPLPLALFAVAFIGTIAFWYGNLDSIIASFGQGSYAPVLAVLSALSFVILTIVALQGMFTVYKRLSTLLILILVSVFFILSSKIFFGPYAILAVFGAVGLFDYVYDWRGRKLKS
ncbi:hypothetical protein [Fluviispira vulneris]|uniref:hypothetical protein n=1 Tax=Fluviispira vulneris TaxID=2763012 RepID=UPI001649072C|nr:hypothetical protein [Fluviispira vulneris]